MRMPPPTPPPPERPARRRFAPRVALVVAAVIVFVLIASARQLAVLYTDKLWFDDLGFGDTWRTLLVARIVPAVIFTLAMFVILLVSLIVADRIAPRFRNMGPEDEIVERYRTFVAPYAGRVRLIVAAVFALLVGLGASSQWREWILFRNRVTWGVKDPQFGKDIGFYVFELPFLRFVAEWLFVVFLVTLLVTAVFHYLNGGIRFQAPYQHVTPQVKAHLSVILALMAITKTAQYWFGRYQLVFSHRGVVDGATYTDVKAQLPALEFLVLISIVAAALFVVNIWQRGWTLPLIAVGLWAFISIVLGTAYPAYVQNFQVKPNEFAKEQKYIQRNIDATRAAFGLDKIKVGSYEYQPQLTRAAVSTPANQATIANTRKWDEGILAGPLTARQEFAGFYKFSPPQSDRYAIGDQSGEQVFVAARNVDVKSLPNDTWTNRHLVYTHGFAFDAAVAGRISPANPQLPNYSLSDIPPKGDLAVPPTCTATVQANCTNQRLYFGDGVADYALGNTKQGELELTNGSGQSTTVHYQGGRGVEMSSFLRKAAFAMRFSDLNLLLSDQVTDQTRLLYVRDVTDRARKAAPFLRFDTSPYLVAQQDGRLVWVLDGYTVTSRYPYAQEIGSDDVDDPNGLGDGYNYARNSVKATVDAYDGTVKFFVIDPSDPMLRAYRKAFPDLFTDAAAMPPDLGAHFRYPQQLFKVQARQFELYHLTKPEDYYKGVDQWAVAPAPSGTAATPVGNTGPTTAPPSGNNGGRNARLRSAANRIPPLYQTLQRPDGNGQEMVLTLPYVPVSKSDVKDTQLTSFLMARNDGYSPDGSGSYGELDLYDVAQDNAISPVAAARQIEQDPTISQQFSLLRQGGSDLILGDVQMLPIGGSIMYVRTVFTKATDQNSFPLLKKVAVTQADKAILADSLDQAVEQLFGVNPPTPGGDGGNPNPTPTDPAGILKELDAAFKAYEQANAKGDYAEAGKQLAKIKELLAAAEKAGITTGSNSPGPGTTTTTTPGGTTTTTPTTAPGATTTPTTRSGATTTTSNA